MIFNAYRPQIFVGDNYTYDNSDGGTEYVQNILTHSYDELTELYGNDKINFEYDDERRLKKITVSGNSGSKTFDYSEDNAKETVTATNENGDVVKCESAKDGSYEKIYYNNSLQLTNNYNKKGELTSVTDSISNENVTYGYNSLGQLTSYTEKQNSATKVKQTFTYDEYGNISQEKITGQASQTYKYSYDNLSDRRFKGMSFSGVTEEVTYDNLDRLETKKVTYNGAEVYTKTYDYRDVKQGAYTNATNQPKNIKFTKGGQTKQQVGYNYQDATGLLSEVNVNGKNINYYYENNNLLREDNRLLNVSQGRSYYGNGNISTYTKGAYQTNNGGNVSGTTTSYTYSGDRMMSYGNQACEYDNMGNPTTYRGKSATWKGRQMLSFDGNNFTYDGIGRRTSKNSLTFLYDDKGNILKQSNDLEFFYDFEGVTSVRHKKQMYFYLRDGQGNIIAIVDSAGSVVVQYYYDAWGNHKVVDENGDEITSSTHIGNLNPFRYRGYYYDVETGLYFLQTRYYDPEVGRFLNRDSVQYADPETINGLNLYAYCLNNPVEYVDPTGHIVISSLLVAIAGIIAGATMSGLFAGANASEGESFGSAFLGGFLNGLLSGVGLAAGLAVAAIGTIPSLVVGGALALSGGFMGGFLGNAVTQAISYGDVDWKVSAIAGGISAGTNLLLFAGLYSASIYAINPKFISRFVNNLKFDIIPLMLSFYLGTLPIFNPNALRGKI